MTEALKNDVYFWLNRSKKAHPQQVIISVCHNLCLCVTELHCVGKEKSAWGRKDEVMDLYYRRGDYQWVMYLEMQVGAEYIK